MLDSSASGLGFADSCRPGTGDERHDRKHRRVRVIPKVSVRIVWLMRIIRWLRRKLGSYANSTETSAPRLAPTALAALPRFTATSKNPLEPRIRMGSLGAPLPKVCTNFEISVFPTRILKFEPARTCGRSSSLKFVSKFPKLSARRTTPFTPLPAAFGFGRLKRTKSVISSPKELLWPFFESHAATGEKISRP